MKNLLSLLLLLPLSLCAQVNDMFYVPQKEIKQSDVAKILSAAEDECGVVDNSNNRDVDEYNRRGKVVPRNSTSLVEEDVYVAEGVDGTYNYDDYDYSTRIVRFHNPTSVVLVSSPLYWDGYWYYDNFWDTHWDFYWHYGVNYPLYRPWFDYTWHTPPPPHYGCHHNIRNNTARRIPVATLSANKTLNGRVPVAGGAVDKKDDKVQASGRYDKKNNPSHRVVNGNKERRERTGVNTRGENKRKSVQSSGSSSTYNRRSSTSVNRSSSSSSRSGGGRTPVSRGGTSRGGRR